jgi:hypothetical protein
MYNNYTSTGNFASTLNTIQQTGIYYNDLRKKRLYTVTFTYTQPLKRK